MQKNYKPSRMVFLFVLVGILLAVYLTTLYNLQLFDTGADANAVLARNTTSKTMTLTANRGDILDRNGIPLVTSRPAYNVTLSRSTLLGRDDINDIILRLIHTAVDNDVPYNDTFPVTIGAPFSYVLNETDTQKKRLQEYLKYFSYFKMGPDISASDLIVKMKEHYGIDYTMNLADARLVIGVRYEMELRAIISMNPYIFAGDVGIDFIMLLEEKHFPGVNIETSAVRKYDTTYAAQMLGYVGSMSPDEYDNYYKALDYSYDAQIGKEGIERALEKDLHGSDGAQKITTVADGTVIGIETTKQPVPGKNVFLTIDIGLQTAVEDILTEKIDEINADPNRGEKDKVPGAAAVVTDVNTGEILACASWPTYDPSTFFSNYSDLRDNPNKPLFNRATMGIYAPGSTFKMVTALAGLKDGIITPTSTINCTGIYLEYVKYGDTYKCWVYPNNHGPENVVGALRESCDFFFYSIADKMSKAGNQAKPIVAVSEDFGFGSRTGIELPDKAGVLPTEENNQKLIHKDWFAANTIMAAIGQDIDEFTPIQLANYAATIANGGTLYKMTLLQSIRSADFTTVLYQPKPTALHTVQGSEYLPYIQKGMREAATDGTAKGTFEDCPVSVACKTGTVQSAKSLENELINNGVFVCYAPADKPQIAISVVVEKGTSGATIADIAKNIIDYYFKPKPVIILAGDNRLQP